MSIQRQYTAVDALLARINDGLRAFDPKAFTPRPSPQASTPSLPEPDRKLAASLMRINHAGEVSAQGLYHGQALFARDAEVRKHLLAAAAEERDHLQWCAARLASLNDHPSRLRPLWYTGSFAIGALAGIMGDKKSLGFIAETERQVSAHLDDHLQRLPVADEASRAVITQMKIDEEKHAEDALTAGGIVPPAPIKALMQLTSKVMKFAAPRL